MLQLWQDGKDKESVEGNKNGPDQLNFDEFEDDESCESGDDHFNLGEFEDQDDVSTDQDVDSIDDTFIDGSSVRDITDEHRASVGRILYLAQQSCPDNLQVIILLSDLSFGVINHGNGMQGLDIRDAYLMDSGSTMNIPIQEQEVSKLDNHYDMPELLFGDQAKDLNSSSDDTSSDDSSSITSSSNEPLADTSRKPLNAGGVIVETCLFVGVVCMTFFELVLIAYLSFLEHAITKGKVVCLVYREALIHTVRPSRTLCATVRTLKLCGWEMTHLSMPLKKTRTSLICSQNLCLKTSSTGSATECLTMIC